MVLIPVANKDGMQTGQKSGRKIVRHKDGGRQDWKYGHKKAKKAADDAGLDLNIPKLLFSRSVITEIVASN